MILLSFIMSPREKYKVQQEIRVLRIPKGCFSKQVTPMDRFLLRPHVNVTLNQLPALSITVVPMWGASEISLLE